MRGLRIIAGGLKGRRIQIPRASSLRPTAEKVREALFSILGPRVDGAGVLDLYSGTGALGFEALSRGARRVVFVETDPAALRALGDNASRLGVAGECCIVAGPVLELLRGRRVGRGYDLVLADPPYAGEEARRCLVQLSSDPALLAPDGLLVLERAARCDPGEGTLERLRTARYGDTCLDFLRHRSVG